MLLVGVVTGDEAGWHDHGRRSTRTRHGDGEWRDGDSWRGDV